MTNDSCLSYESDPRKAVDESAPAPRCNKQTAMTRSQWLELERGGQD